MKNIDALLIAFKVIMFPSALLMLYYWCEAKLHSNSIKVKNELMRWDNRSYRAGIFNNFNRTLHGYSIAKDVIFFTLLAIYLHTYITGFLFLFYIFAMAIFGRGVMFKWFLNTELNLPAWYIGTTAKYDRILRRILKKDNSLIVDLIWVFVWVTALFWVLHKSISDL